MKKMYIILLSLFAVTFSSFALQNVIDSVVTALKAGNATELGRHFDEYVELVLPDRNDHYSKAQAELIVKDFFEQNKVRGFTLKHKGESPGGGHYCIGLLETQNGNYRTNVFLKLRSAREVIKEIRFQAIE
ncbi:MAG: DUF4783 domain-containing protein [Chitinophagaceae bacterium]|nr:DUF4783 domain-containing protein [Chitinophagaceae bacterium]